MAQVPERCMQMLKQIIMEIENRQNITRDQLALLLETTDDRDIAFFTSGHVRQQMPFTESRCLSVD
mgnify:CR=1 FL=1